MYKIPPPPRPYFQPTPNMTITCIDFRVLKKGSKMLDVVTCLNVVNGNGRDTGYIGHRLKGYGLLKSLPLLAGHIFYMRANIPKL